MYDPDQESDVIGADAADATSGMPESAEEWAIRQPLVDAPTRPLDAGEPSPHQPAAATPEGVEPPIPASTGEKGRRRKPR